MPYVTLRRRAAASIAAAALATVALAGPAAASPAPVSPSPYVPTQGSPQSPTSTGIIMRDGGVAAAQVKMISPPAASS
jgi:hypothetical protein